MRIWWLVLVLGCDKHENVPTPVAVPDGMVMVGTGKDAFFIDRNEVTADEYERCAAAGACVVRMAPEEGACMPPRPDDGARYKLKPKSGNTGAVPANFVGPKTARDYCAWVKKLLPTADQWKRAKEKGLLASATLTEWTADQPNKDLETMCIPSVACSPSGPCTELKLQAEDTGVRCALEIVH